MRSFLEDVFQTRYREATASAILFAIVIGLVMNAAITYAGLKIGFTMGGSAIAAVLGFGVLRGVLRRGSILETNMAQTCASAVNTSNAGIIFTVPVLFLLGLPLATDSADFWLITLAAVGGAVLGTAFIIPLRKQMIEIDRLRFPTGMGVAAILKSPGAGPRKALVLLGGVVAGAAVYWFVAAEQLGLPSYGSLGIGVLTADALDAGRLLGFPPQLELIFGIAPFALGAGYITGRPGLFVLAGGVLAYHVLTPFAYSVGWMPQTVAAHEAPAYAFNAFNRPLGRRPDGHRRLAAGHPGGAQERRRRGRGQGRRRRARPAGAGNGGGAGRRAPLRRGLRRGRKAVQPHLPGHRRVGGPRVRRGPARGRAGERAARHGPGAQRGGRRAGHGHAHLRRVRHPLRRRGRRAHVGRLRCGAQGRLPREQQRPAGVAGRVPPRCCAPRPSRSSASPGCGSPASSSPSAPA